MAGSLGLEILYNSEPAFCVPEYAELELYLTNAGSQRLTQCSLRVGSQILKNWPQLAPAQTWSFSYNVGDLVGEIGFVARALDGSQEVVVAQTLEVVPQKISPAELIFIKTARLPTLLSRLNAPNRLQLSYDDNEATPPFDFFSLEYTAEKLEYFSHHLLEQGLNAAIINHLDYSTPQQLQSGVGLIQGPLDWQATVKTWLNRPELAGYQHHWQTSPKFYGTLPNLLLVNFNLEIARELKQLAELVQTARPKPTQLQARLSDLLNRAHQHRAFLKNSPLAHFMGTNKDYKADAAWQADLKRTCANAPNLAYVGLFELWEAFCTRYVTLPGQAQAADLSLQPMSKIYELWTVCEVAFALDLKCMVQTGVSGAFYFEGTTEWGQMKLHYNRALAGGWYSRSRPGLPRPDIRLEIAGPPSRQLFLDVKYRVNQSLDGTTRAKPDDMYKMLAYMHDFGTATGGIIYPGAVGQIAGLVIQGQADQRLIELALRPLPDQSHLITAQLKAQLDTCISPRS